MRKSLEEEKNPIPEEDNDNQSEKETILFRNIDANVDKYSIELEKQIQKLPNPLRFIKKYVHFYFLPRLENVIDELESIRQTPNYDEKVVQIRPTLIKSISSEIISCIDLLNNSNIAHPTISKMVFGTMKGNLGVYDFDSGKIVLEVNISKQNRVEHISTSTVKYFDTYQTRIAACCRGESNIYILSFNHSFTGISTECILNTINPEDANPPQAPEKLNLANVVSGLKLSKDGYFLSVTDYASGVRIFNFADLGISSTGGVQGAQQTSNSNNNAISESNEENTNPIKNSESNIINESEKKNPEISSIPQVGEHKLTFIYVGRFTANKSENFTILPNEAQQVDDKNKKNVKDNKDNKKKDMKKGRQEEVESEEKNLEEYNIKSEFDEEKGDISLYQPFPENHPYTHFVQKQFIFEDNSNSEYSTSTITIGLYIAYSNTTCFKFISLNEYLTEKMKSVFRVKKIKNNYTMSIEDSMNLNSQMLKKEKDFLQFIRQKLDPNKKNIISAENPENEQNPENLNKKPQPPTTAPKGGKIEEQKKTDTKILANIPNANSLLTKKEMNFTTCFNITIMNGQKEINKYNNLLGIGMIDGSVLVWDCELHTDKFLLQKNSRFEITSISIDENYLICGSVKGQIYIYNLIDGKELFNCAHDPYSVSSFQTFMSFFPFMNIGFDANDRICLYNSKEAHKISKLIFNSESGNNKEQYKICFYNKFLCDYNNKYIAFICEKKSKEDIKKQRPKNILDLINFSKERVEILRNKPNDKVTNFYNNKILELNTQLMKVDINKTNSNLNITNAPKENSKIQSPKKERDKKPAKPPQKKEENPAPDEEQIPEPMTKLDLKDNIIIIYRVLDVLFKCYPNLAYSHKKGMSLRKIMKKYKFDEYPTFSASEQKKEGMMNIKYLTSDLKKRASGEIKSTNLKKDLTGLSGKNTEEKENKGKKDKKEKGDKHHTTQRKDVFYNSFKNIKERYHYKEERINLLQNQKQKIINDLKEQNNNKSKKIKK